jgi:hypothetical protein
MMSENGLRSGQVADAARITCALAAAPTPGYRPTPASSSLKSRPSAPGREQDVIEPAVGQLRP